MKPLAASNSRPRVEVTIPTLHDCRRDGGWVRHRAPITYRRVRLNSGDVRLDGVRCDGTPIALYCQRLPSGDLVADPHDTHERYLIEAGGAVWVSSQAGPWLPLEDGCGVEQPSLFGEAS